MVRMQYANASPPRLLLDAQTPLISFPSRMLLRSSDDKVWAQLPLIGRTEELSVLMTAMREAQGGAGGVRGEVRPGKKRVPASQLQGRARSGRVEVLRRDAIIAVIARSAS